MARSLGMTAYRAWSRRLPQRRYASEQKRPSGPLIWIYAPEPENLLAIQSLAHSLCAALPELNILVTMPDEDSLRKARNSWDASDSITLAAAPSEHPDEVTDFWRHWEPDVGIWTWGRLRPNLLSQAHRAKCPMILIDADKAGFDGRRDRWIPDLSRQLLTPFAALMVRSVPALQRLEALGLSTGRIDIAPPLEAGGRALPCEDTDLSDLSAQLHGRPVWFASNIQGVELSAVIAAHRDALRLSHRLVLILHAADSNLGADFVQTMTDAGFRTADWSAGDTLDDTTQVLLSTDDGDLGLFYRASPVVLMGSSLAPGFQGRNPFEAAALGSAVLYGPHVKHYMPFYTRLANAGAASLVKDPKTLGAAVTQLIAPDQAAMMAHAGWDVISKSADLTDRVTELVQAALDGELDVTHASA